MRICDRCSGREKVRGCRLPTVIVMDSEHDFAAGRPDAFVWRDLCETCRYAWGVYAANFVSEQLPQAAP